MSDSSKREPVNMTFISEYHGLLHRKSQLELLLFGRFIQ